MDMNEVIAEVNKGGWVLEGNYSDGRWVQGLGKTILRAGPMTVKGLSRRPSTGLCLWFSSRSRQVMSSPEPYVIECVGGTDERPLLERITLKGPSLDSEGHDAGIKAKMVLVNYPAMAQNKLHNDQQIRERIDRHGIKVAFTAPDMIVLYLPDGPISFRAVQGRVGPILKATQES